MLRLTVLVLLLANAGYYAWSHNYLLALGMGPVAQTEPQRLEQQVAPEKLQVLTPSEAPKPGAPDASAAAAASAPSAPLASAAPVQAASTSAASATPEPTVCLQAGAFDEAQTDALRRAAASLPAGSWTLDATPVSGRWMVYMGKFADNDALDKKRAELRARKVDFDRPNNPSLEPGLSLGRYSTEEAAHRALTALGSQGVRTARVVQERGDTPAWTLHLPAATAALRSQVETQLVSVLASKPLRSCN
ncbi:SPOR domain-containing protein [Variovorax sp. HJSM1_2]|uniref:SPOR domain-containing protein n=1 Tax=Variovorax sp. HJSM1_2 TaxID=3366263 RepID=UPI003BBB583C